MPEINDFKDLKIWQKGMDIAEKCYFLTKSFPKDELYGMVQQIRKSAVSIPANIAEGYGRRSTAEYIRFLNIAQQEGNGEQGTGNSEERTVPCSLLSKIRGSESPTEFIWHI
jgi:hypothetical protein